MDRILASNTPGGGVGVGVGAGGGGGGGLPLNRGAAPGGAEPSGTQPSGPTGTAPGTGATPPSSSGSTGSGTGSLSPSSAVAFLVNQGDALISQGKPVEARDVFNRALFDGRATESDRIVLRDKLATLAEALTFSPRVEPGDVMSEAYAFQSGDRLVKLPYSKDLAVDWRLIARVNRIADPGKIRLNQRVKLIKGPFHAVVHKGAFRMDVFADAKDSAGNRIYIKSFAVGLGEQGSTPTGAFIVKPKSKLVNPKWVNPRTGEKFAADDPKNPIGERWLGLDGTDATTKLLSGYGIHGTIEPESIGQERSMGCVRLADRDVEFVYELLFEGRSVVEIRP
ncbi:MAG: L,D-transpeptidase family protein [Phycisphaerales bacterium]